jgi:hypothetical protein
MPIAGELGVPCKQNFRGGLYNLRHHYKFIQFRYKGDRNEKINKLHETSCEILILILNLVPFQSDITHQMPLVSPTKEQFQIKIPPHSDNNKQ